MKTARASRRRYPRQAASGTSRHRTRANDRLAWTGVDLLNGEIVPSLTVLLTTKGCYWARRDGCTMCGYIADANPDAPKLGYSKTTVRVLAQYGTAFKIVKLFTSGSFLDQEELPLDARDAILSALADMPKSLLRADRNS